VALKACRKILRSHHSSKAKQEFMHLEVMLDLRNHLEKELEERLDCTLRLQLSKSDVKVVPGAYCKSLEEH